MYLVIANTFGVDIDKTLKEARKGKYGDILKENIWIIPEEYDDVNVSIKRLLTDYDSESDAIIYDKAKEFIEHITDIFQGIIIINREVTAETIEKYGSLIEYFKNNNRKVLFIQK